MVKKIVLILLFSVLLHESTHLAQIVLCEEVEYSRWGIGILEDDIGSRPLGFYFEVDTTLSDRKIFFFEVQAYGIQILFLVIIILYLHK